MKKELTNKNEMILVGLKIRTNNENEMSSQTAKIGEISSRFWNQNIASQILHRKNPGVTLSVYAEYESNEHGDYTYFIGEEVSSFADIPSGLEKLTIPAAKYQKFTTPVGQMPDVIIDAWEKIWEMSESDFEGKRAYLADFEVYDHRANDSSQTSLDVYIGIE